MNLISRRRLLACTALALPAAASAQIVPGKPVKVETLVFAPDAQVAGSPLVLNGVGLRAVAWVKGYAAGLYLTKRAANAQAVVATPGAKRLDIRMLLDVGMEEFSKALRRGIGRNTPAGDVAKMQDRIDRFDAQLNAIGKVKKKDIITIDWVPATGTVLSLNGKPRGDAVAGEDFYAAVLRIFIGDKVSDEELKTGLLGGPVS
jgi:hypothetical protein